MYLKERTRVHILLIGMLNTSFAKFEKWFSINCFLQWEIGDLCSPKKVLLLSLLKAYFWYQNRYFYFISSFLVLKSRNTCMETNFRLSSFASKQLTTNNPNIADLSDRNRPTKLGEKFEQLYDNEWSEAFEYLKEIPMDEDQILKTLVDISRVKWFLKSVDFAHINLVYLTELPIFGSEDIFLLSLALCVKRLFFHALNLLQNFDVVVKHQLPP